MATMCKISPDKGKGQQFFNEAKKILGYHGAWNIWALSQSKTFMNGKTFTRDSEGFPSFSEFIEDRDVTARLTDQEIKAVHKNKFITMPNNRDNYEKQIIEAHVFNEKTENKGFIAIVKADEENVTVDIQNRTIESERTATEQYGTYILNSTLESVLAPTGIEIGHITAAEMNAGRIGITDFTKAKNLATDVAQVIRVANNDEGYTAIGEEFSHLVIGAFQDHSIIQRALNLLKNETILKAILGSEYQSVVEFQDGNIDLIAEEALGKLLRENLLAESYDKLSNYNSVLERALKYIKNKFKGLDDTEITKALTEANSLLGQFAKDLLNKNLELKKEKIKAAERIQQFNALSDRIDANMEILKQIRDVEIKRFKITKFKATEEGKKERVAANAQLKNINDLLKSKVTAETEIKARIAIFNYAKQALNIMKEIHHSLGDRTSFGNIRRARSFVQSYAGFIQQMLDAIESAERDKSTPNYFTDIQIKDGQTINLVDIIKELSFLSDQVTSRYAKLAENKLIEFLKPAFGVLKNNGINIDVKALIKQAESDISFSDMFFDSMSSSSDLYLQALSYISKAKMDEARHIVIDKAHAINDLMKYADSHGIKDFEWMFEHDNQGNKTGNYISRLNFGVFKQAKADFLQELAEKYKNKRSTKDKIDQKNELVEWLNKNADPENPEAPADIEAYRNKDFEAVMNNDAKAYIYNKFMDMKKEADLLYPDNRVSTYKAIQRRKTKGNRLVEMLKNPTKIVDNIKNAIREDFLDNQEDDVNEFGEKVRSSLTNFDNTEYMMLPVLYTNRLRNPNEISTDIFGSLLAYTYSATVFDKMDDIVDPMEVARFWVTDGHRKIVKTRGTNAVVEKINLGGQMVINKLYKKGSQIEAKLDYFMESQIYHRYIKDEGVIPGTNINIAKTGNWLLRLSSAAQLGFNWLANSANVVTGLAMTNIEAAAGEYFTAKQLAEADSAYLSLIWDKISEVGSRYQTNKLDLFEDFMNIKQDYKNRALSNKMSSLLQKIFGSSIAYLGQDAGDNWLYDRIAIAICKNTNIKIPKNSNKVKAVTSLAEAIKAVDQIVADSDNFKLSEDETHYVDKQSGKTFARVTSTLAADSQDFVFAKTHPDGSPNNWITPATSIGNSIDATIRMFFSNEIHKEGDLWRHTSGTALTQMVGNVSYTHLASFLDQLQELKEEFDKKGLTVIAKDVVASGKVEVMDGTKVKNLRVTGTVDLLLHDKDGNFYIYDIKTHRSNNIDNKKIRKWSAQVSMYKQLLEQKYGIQVKGLGILPVKVTYPTPKGEFTKGEEGTTKYTRKDDTDQLLANGTDYKGAHPIKGDIISISEHTFNLRYENLNENQEYVEDIEEGEYEHTNLWDALQIEEFGGHGLKKMKIPEGAVMEDGSKVDVSLISRQIADVQIDLFGAYNPEDMNAANHLVLGRALMQMRKFMKPAYNRRFQAAQKNLITGKTKEGYYRTLVRVANELRRGQYQLNAMKDNISEEDYKNIKRALFEIFQFVLCLGLVALRPPTDRKKRPWALKYLDYMAEREKHELGMFTPSLTMVHEITKTVKEPFAVMSTIKNTTSLISSLLTPADYIDELQSGPYTGMSTLEKNFIKAPIPVISWYRQVSKFTGDLDTSLQYYTRPY